MRREQELETYDFSKIEDRMRFARNPDDFGSIADTAKLLYISKNSLQRYESGKTPPTVAVLQAMVMLYRVDPGWLLMGIGKRPETVQERHERWAASDSYGGWNPHFKRINGHETAESIK